MYLLAYDLINRSYSDEYTATEKWRLCWGYKNSESLVVLPTFHPCCMCSDAVVCREVQLNCNRGKVGYAAQKADTSRQFADRHCLFQGGVWSAVLRHIFNRTPFYVTSQSCLTVLKHLQVICPFCSTKAYQTGITSPGWWTDVSHVFPSIAVFLFRHHAKY